MDFRIATLTAARTLSPDVRELTLDPGQHFRFVPGQWVSVRIPRDGTAEPLSRAYSIASWPREDGCFDLAVTRVEEGPVSTHLHGCEVGSRLLLTDAQGFFTMPETLPRPVLAVATGTGIAPLRAMIHAVRQRGNAQRIDLLFGARTGEDLLYAAEWADLEREVSWFRFVPTLSRPGEDWAGLRGYVQAHVAERARALDDCDAYVCGLSDMVTAVRRVLKEDLGLARQRIHTERYD